MPERRHEPVATAAYIEEFTIQSNTEKGVLSHYLVIRRDSFTVENAITPLAVETEGRAVVGIRFDQGRRPLPRTEFERWVATELTEYLAGERRAFTVPIGLRGSAFERAVWDAIRRIPYAESMTYGEVARTVGRPGAARAVGSATGRNPVPLIIPCHRVVGSSGKLGGFGGGVELKRRLLALEARSCGPERQTGAELSLFPGSGRRARSSLPEDFVANRGTAEPASGR